MDLTRKPSESFLDYADRLITERDNKILDIDNAEIYELLFNEQVSSDHARKCISGIRKTLEQYKLDPKIEYVDDENELDEELKRKSSIEICNDGSYKSEKLLRMSEEESKDINYLLKAHGFDLKVWELVSARNNIWNVYSKQDGVQVLYSSKIVVKPKTEYQWNEEDIIKIFNNLKLDYKNKVNIIPSQYIKNNNILIVPIADLHYGLYSDKLSTGNYYNLDIAEEYYYRVLLDIRNRSENKKFEKVLFIIGNDFVNFDNLSNTTTKGTPQDASNSWFTIVDKATQLIIDGIDLLTEIAPVDVLYVPSNHDLHTMFGIMQTIRAWYKNDKNITVDISPLPRKYYKFGKTLLSLSHDIKIKDILKIITTEAKDNWTDCEHIICMLAHLHQEMIYDKQGYLEILRLPTISGWSRWTCQQGYVQSDKKNQSFIINGNDGIIETWNTIVK